MNCDLLEQILPGEMERIYPEDAVPECSTAT